MRISLLLLPLAAVAAPVVAAPPPQAPPPAIEIPPALTDPAMADTLGTMMEALSKAFLDIPIGGIEAAVEGRPPSPADRSKTVRDVAGGPEIERQLAQTRPVIEHGVKTFAQALPALASALADVAARAEQAVATMPRPDYPRR